MEFIPVPARVSGRSYLDAKAPGVTSCLPLWGSGCRGSGHGCVALNDTPVKRCVRTGQGLPCLLWSHKVNQAQARGKASAASQPAMPVPGHVPYWWTLTCDFTFQLDLNMPYCYGFVWRSLSWQLNQLSITSLELLLLVRCHGTAHLCSVKPLPHVCFGVTLDSQLSFAWGAALSCASLATATKWFCWSGEQLDFAYRITNPKWCGTLH